MFFESIQNLYKISIFLANFQNLYKIYTKILYKINKFDSFLELQSYFLIFSSRDGTPGQRIPPGRDPGRDSCFIDARAGHRDGTAQNPGNRDGTAKFSKCI